MSLDPISPLDTTLHSIQADGGARGAVFHGVGAELPSSEHREIGTAAPIPAPSVWTDIQYRLLLLDLYDLSSAACSRLGAAEAIPFINLLAAPTFLAHALQRAKARAEVTQTALKAKEYGEAFFWGCRTTNAAGTAVSNINRTVKGQLMLFGVMDKAAVALIFTAIMPVVLLIFGVLMAAIQTATLRRNHMALKKFNEVASTPGWKGIQATLRYLQGPQGHGENEQQRAKLELDRVNFSENHFTSNEREHEIRSRIAALNQKIASKWEQAGQQVSNLAQNISKLDENVNIEQLIHIYGDLEKLPLDDKILGAVQRNKAELLELVDEGKEIVDLSRSEMHRVVLYNILFLIIALLVVADGIILLINPGFATASMGITIAAAVLEIAYVAFDKKVTAEQFLQLERMLIKQ